MMVSAGFDHKNDALGDPETDPNSATEPISFKRLDGSEEYVYSPDSENSCVVIERPSISQPSTPGPSIGPE